MNTIMDLCFLCTKDYNCVLADERIVSQVEYLLPEITIIKLGIPLRICSVCDGALYAFSKFKQFYVESSQRLEARIKGAQGPPIHTGSPPVVDDSEASDVKPEKIEETFNNEEYMEQTPLDTNRAFLDPIALSETINAEPHNQLHKDRVSHNIQLHTDTNVDNKEAIFVREEQIEETPQDWEFYNKVVKEEYVSNLMHDDTDRQPDHNTEDESATLNISEEDFEGSSADSEEESVDETHGKNISRNIQTLQCTVSLSLSCSVCNKEFKDEHILNRHMKIHSSIKKFGCEICSKSFTRKAHLNTHMKHHSGVKDFRCEICEKSFTQNSTLTRHMKIHSGIKDFRCQICGVSFTYNFNLISHLKTHSGV